jgi:hypothetical protein
MLRRLLLGFVEGILVGGLVALGLVKGLGLVTLGAWLGYAAAAGTGLLTGFIAGQPIWRKGAGVEAGLKALFGALLGVGILFAVRRWLDFPVDLAALGLGSGTLGALPVTSLPLVATVLALFFELDNTAGGAPGTPRARVAQREAQPELEAEADAEVEAAPPAERRR